MYAWLTCLYNSNAGTLSAYISENHKDSSTVLFYQHIYDEYV